MSSSTRERTARFALGAAAPQGSRSGPTADEHALEGDVHRLVVAFDGASRNEWGRHGTSAGNRDGGRLRSRGGLGRAWDVAGRSALRLAVNLVGIVIAGGCWC